MDELHDLAARLNRQEREGGQIIYNAVAAHEPAGKKLAECALVPVTLDYVTAEDWELADRDNAEALKWARLTRFTVQAKNQGAVLTQPDLVHLLGLSTKAVQGLSRRHPNVILPTRGMVADMGPALSHADKIIRLYTDGYTETEIVRRTGHSYDSVERYLLDFAKVVDNYLRLFDRVLLLRYYKLPVSVMMRVTGHGKALLEEHLTLVEKHFPPMTRPWTLTLESAVLRWRRAVREFGGYLPYFFKLPDSSFCTSGDPYRRIYLSISFLNSSNLATAI